MSIKIKILFIIIVLLVIIVSLLLGGKIAFKEQMVIYDGLRNTSAIIFAVMGAWIALLYPQKLSQAFGKKPYKEKSDDIDQINRLFRPMIYSTSILSIVIGMAFIVPLAKQVEYLIQFKEIFRALSFAVIAFLTMLQFWSLVLTLVPGDSIKDDLDEDKERQKMLARMRPGKK
ncbi:MULTISPECIES: hypothetical protein [Colwellia]|uniref:Uncharacterized protein n=1 Tax=Colwellia marinimaniae TaxID=1513592 RepID=A0ABQ0N010_9GAMM|nr:MULTISPECIES: hypothetical protein [Colwellia]GAW97954.1 hypothetical protein MTCD1_03609 [Colwellia marinimaniae]